MRDSIEHIIAAVVIVVLGLIIGLSHIDDFPAYVHAWSQSDWYSIAIRFTENGYDFFHPETFIYNKQYPGHWAIAYETTVTSVDFPIHQYFISLLMSLFGSTAPWIYRGWTLVCSLVGMFFFYLLCRRLTGSILKSLLVVIVAMTSPLYAYYFNNYLTTAPALALAMAGLWAMICYWKNSKEKYWHWGIVLIGISTLIRSSFAVMLVVVCCYEASMLIAKRSAIKGKFFSLFPVLLAIMGYYFWNMHLRDVDGSIFLGTLDSPTSWNNLVEIWRKIREYWQFTYFSHLQHWVVFIAFVSAMVWQLVKRKRPSKLWFFVAIWFFGEALFFLAMMAHYVDHDYYFLDSFYLPILFIFALSLAELPSLKGDLTIIAASIMLMLLGGTMYNMAKHEVQNRCHDDERTLECNMNFEGAGEWLDEVGVPRDARILVAFSYPQNSPFIQMKRKGYSLMWYDQDIVDSAFYSFPYDYIVIEDDVFRRHFKDQRRVLSHLKRIAGNGRLSLCSWKDDMVNKTVFDFFRVENYVYIGESGGFEINGYRWFPLMLNYKAEMKYCGDSMAVVPAKYYQGRSMKRHFDTIASWGFNTVRICLDAISEKEDTSSMFRATRRMVDTAEMAGLKVLLLIKPPFEEYWREYTKGLLRTLADMPTVWAYDFMNEPLYFDPKPGRDKNEAVEIAEQWRIMVRRYAPKQLFTIATAEPIEVFEWDPSMLPIDFVEMHTYNPLRAESEMYWYSRYCGGRPWIIGETGLPADGDSIPYYYQGRYMYATYFYAICAGAAGYGWWEFQDNPRGVNFEAKYTGLSRVDGTPKPAANLAKSIGSIDFMSPKERPVNYFNMLAYQNVAVTGKIVDANSEPIEGAVIRGWNEDWSVGMNTYTHPDGTFRLVSNDICTHFEVSAPGYNHLRFDMKLRYPKDIELPEKSREYQSIDYRPYLSEKKENRFLPDDSTLFKAQNAVEAKMGTLKLRKL